jgi:hypothetical protein
MLEDVEKVREWEMSVHTNGGPHVDMFFEDVKLCVCTEAM